MKNEPTDLQRRQMAARRELTGCSQMAARNFVLYGVETNDPNAAMIHELRRRVERLEALLLTPRSNGCPECEMEDGHAYGCSEDQTYTQPSPSAAPKEEP